MGADERYPDLLPPDELVALTQRLDDYRAIARAGLDDLEWGSSRHLLAIGVQKVTAD